MFQRKVMLVVVVLGMVTLFACESLVSTPIKNVLQDPRAYEGKTVTIGGEVSDRTSLLVMKYFVLKDSTGEITVLTDRALPAVGSKLRVKGKVQQAFAIGNQQLVVLIEEPGEGSSRR
jgi:hypothetical protein